MLTKIRRKLNKKGFTLIELMIVIAIIGILAAIAIPQFASYRQKSYNSAAQSDLRNVKTNQLSTLEVAGVFVAVGLKPNSQPFANVVELSEKGHIVTDELMATSAPGLFAAGDIRMKSARQIASAVGDGATAALSAFNYLRG